MSYKPSYKAIQPRFPAGRLRGAGGGLRPFIYVKGSKFLPVFKAWRGAGRVDNRGHVKESVRLR